MQLGKSFLLLISLVLAYCAADIQVQQVQNSLEEVTDIETGGVDVKDQLEDIVEYPEEVQDKVAETLDQPELSQSDSIEDIEETELIEEISTPEIIIKETNHEEEIISVEEVITDVSEDEFSEFAGEDSLMDIDEAAEVLSEEIESEKKVGFFARLVRTLSFGRKN